MTANVHQVSTNSSEISKTGVINHIRVYDTGIGVRMSYTVETTPHQEGTHSLRLRSIR
jgi:hypothetical protein